MDSQPPGANFPVTVLNGIHLVQLPPRLSILEAVAFKDNFKQLSQDYPELKRVILDMSQTTFIDSSGIGTLVGCLKTARLQQTELIFWSIHPQVMMAFSLTGLHEVFTIDDGTQAVIPTAVTSPRPRRAELGPPVTHPSVRSRTKRLLDIVGALVGLVITAVLFIPIAIAIKLDSNGPILFGQTRCGWMGRKFRIWKFRSMVPNAEALKSKVKNQAEGAIFKNDNDPRVTRVGRFLRRTSLDELPQFWNVLRGEMSLVGTRPPTPDEMERYEVPKWQRLDVKPGMTGEWQVSGRSQIRDFEEIIRLDLRYQENWSLLYDIKLIFRTIAVVFNRNAGAV
ncbi:MAG: sugar transferase [Desertifilum sp.]|nr:sugar transferase [Desertifilum sp.]MDI9636423.1 sugar transferase [Geitlerinema splendidum]